MTTWLGCLRAEGTGWWPWLSEQSLLPQSGSAGFLSSQLLFPGCCPFPRPSWPVHPLPQGSPWPSALRAALGSCDLPVLCALLAVASPESDLSPAAWEARPLRGVCVTLPPLLGTSCGHVFGLFDVLLARCGACPGRNVRALWAWSPGAHRGFIAAASPGLESHLLACGWDLPEVVLLLFVGVDIHITYTPFLKTWMLITSAESSKDHLLILQK